jgi:hypothetical protein
MATRIPDSPYAWVFTDVRGRIETASRGAREILGHAWLNRGDDLLQLLPLPRKALALDIQIALTGWPTEREVTLRWLGVRPVVVRYRVSRRLQPEGAALYWQLELRETDDLQQCA